MPRRATSHFIAIAAVALGGLVGVGSVSRSRAHWASIAIVVLWGLVGAAVAQAQGTPLRQVDWPSVLRAERQLETRPCDDFEARIFPVVPCLYVNAGGDLGGYAGFDSMLYGDLDGDGGEDGVMRLISGGTAGVVGYLVFSPAVPQPRLVVVADGYQLGLEIAGGSLVVSRPTHLPTDANCCATALQRTPYRLVGGRLVAGPAVWFLADSAGEYRPAEPAEIAVVAFYKTLSAGLIRDAYTLLSPAYQAANPFEPWSSGYATIQRVDVETRPGATAGEVLVTLVAEDRLPSGGTATRRFSGTWRLVSSPTAEFGWLLDRADIRELR